MNPALIKKIKEKNSNNEKIILSPYACKSSDGIRRYIDKDDSDVRSKFFHDTDRIIHSKSYTRYIDKTQVFYLIENDEITHRVLHVQLVSKIGREIGRELSLNEDLIEAIALGHDIGHAPFGHDGEYYLTKISQKYKLNDFNHNEQSIRALEYLENNGEGLNLTLQVLDGILCHNGELYLEKIAPNINKTFDLIDNDINKQNKKIIPMTMEGSVVRFSDIFGYIGRDIEDAITLGLIKRADIPKNCIKILGKSNREIVNNLVHDIVETSYDKPYISLSKNIFTALTELKKFNYQNIYLNEKIKTESAKIENIFVALFDLFLRDIKTDNVKSLIFTDFLNNMNEKYINSTIPELMVRDFIAGMTNKYLINCFNEYFLPKKLGVKF